VQFYKEKKMNVKKLYKKVAKMHGVTPEEVQREIQIAIDATYKNSGKPVPTPKEFIKNAISQI
jgi:hypothetical protein